MRFYQLLFSFLPFAIVASGCVSNATREELSSSVDAEWSELRQMYDQKAEVTNTMIIRTRGFADQEQSALQATADAINGVEQFDDISDKQVIRESPVFADVTGAYQSLNDATDHLRMITQNYPELRSNEDFLSTIDRLDGIDRRIEAQTIRYNHTAAEANEYLEAFPRRISPRVSEDDLWPLIEANQPIERVN